MPETAKDVIARLARRAQGRAEASIQADIRQFLLTADLNLSSDQVVELEVPVSDGTRRRIDIEIGHAVIEVKRDLSNPAVRLDAVKQLSGYVRSQATRLGTRYVGILTDGKEWSLYHLDPLTDQLSLTMTLTLAGNDQDYDNLCTWIETILATLEDVSPTPRQIELRLGADSAAYRLDHATLIGLYRATLQTPAAPEVELKRQLWAKLLRTSFGSNFTDDEALFVDHTLLVLTAEIIAHAVLGFDLTSLANKPQRLVSGTAFADALIYGVVEADFFDWVMHAPGGAEFVTSLTQRLARFAWNKVDHDVLKVLYESVISADTRYSLGEYYTPDWLAERMVLTTVEHPLHERVLDPSCGSGTFLFHAVRHYLAAADGAGFDNAAAVEGVTGHVIGVDVHPVAVILARVTYLLAIGTDKLAADDRGPISVPVYLGDSIQWDQHEGTIEDGNVTVRTSGTDLAEHGQAMIIGDDLVFPETLVTDAGRFDRLISELADRATKWTGGQADFPAINAVLKRHQLAGREAETVEATFRTMCRLHADGRDHIWGYYVRNLLRPLWLALPGNQVHVLIGNPPWLRYAAMSAVMQKRFTDMSRGYGLISGRRGASGRDLAALFVVRSSHLYLREGGGFSFVMPRSVLTRKPYAGFRTGRWASAGLGDLTARFDTSWDLDKVKPTPFPVPAAIVKGKRSVGAPLAMPPTTEVWAGRIAMDSTWEVVKEKLAISSGTTQAVSEADYEGSSPYLKRFRQGAVLAPRVLLYVSEGRVSPLGPGGGRQSVVSKRTSQEKPPWKSVPSLEGNVERPYIRPVHLGSTILPYRTLEPVTCVLPISKGRILPVDEIEEVQGLSEWWERAETIWQENKSKADDGRLLDRIDFHGQLSAQLPISQHRIVYSASGNSIAAARIDERHSIIEHKLYWATATSPEEAYYLVAILNSTELLKKVEPLQSRGAFGPRDFDKYIFRTGIPLYDSTNSSHLELVEMSAHAERVAAGVALPTNVGFQAARGIIRDALIGDGVSSSIDVAVKAILPDPMTLLAQGGA